MWIAESCALVNLLACVNLCAVGGLCAFAKPCVNLYMSATPSMLVNLCKSVTSAFVDLCVLAKTCALKLAFLCAFVRVLFVLLHLISALHFSRKCLCSLLVLSDLFQTLNQFEFENHHTHLESRVLSV